MLVMFAVYVTATAVATELALRGWIVERVLELSPGPPVLPVLVGAIAEALVTPGDLAARLGGGLFGVGLGWIYAAGGRNLLAPICARVVFELGVVLLEALRSRSADRGAPARGRRVVDSKSILERAGPRRAGATARERERRAAASRLLGRAAST